MRISAIVPTLNRSASLRRTLESLAAVADDELEIMVVDNGSTDATPAVFAEMQARHPGRSWRYLREPIPGLLSGRHRGAREAQGEICAFLDDDVSVSPGWLKSIREAFARPGVGLAGGPSTPHYETPPPDWLAGFWERDAQGEFCTWLSLFAGGEHVKPIDPRYVWGLNFIIRRQTLLDLGGFHPDCLPKSLQRFQGDGETGLADKLQAAGIGTVYHPGIAVTHEIPAARLTARYFENRAFYQGVCDSYTRIRSHGIVAPARPSWRGVLRRFKQQVLGLGLDPELRRVREATARAYRAGFAFHQGAVREDPALLAWVTRPDYLDYRLPDGWERFAATPPEQTG
jgi:glycosyltransferase involved in cell wall biosynthesis